MSTQQSVPPQAALSDAQRGGYLYMQTNETRNAIIHYPWAASGTLTEVDRIPTGGSGSGDFSPIYQVSRPNDFEGAASVILTPDRRFLLTTNGGDNTVSSFGVSEDGQLTLLDVKPTGNAVTGRTGTADSLAYASSSDTLFVLHAFGPDHIGLMSVDGKGTLTPRPERYSVNTHTKTDRVTTSATLSPDERFLLVGTIFDERPSVNPDGAPKYVIANTSDPDGLVVFLVGGDGTLGAPSFHDAGGGVPFYFAFLNGRLDRFLIGEAIGDGLVMSSIDADGRVDIGYSCRSTPAQASPLSCAGWPSRRMTDWCSRRTSGTATSAATASTAPHSPSRGIPPARGFREMAP